MLGSSPCIFGELTDKLSLNEAVERALCGHPETRAAWTELKAQAAALGIAESAYLPTVTATGQEVRTGTKTRVNNQSELDSSEFDTTYTASATLSWVLYDFGGREAALDNAIELIAAAKANLSGTLQTVFLGAAKNYYQTQAANGAFLAARETEEFARRTLEAARTRVGKGLSPVSDALQAETAYVQAQINRAKAEAEK
jgi:outer membrane protein